MTSEAWEKAVEAGAQEYCEGGCSGLADYERREVVEAILRAAFPILAEDVRQSFINELADAIGAMDLSDSKREVIKAGLRAAVMRVNGRARIEQMKEQG